MGQARQKIMTSRELTDSIDRLIIARIDEARLLSFTGQAHFDHMPERQRISDEIEVLKRTIADSLKRLDHNPGVYLNP